MSDLIGAAAAAEILKTSKRNVQHLTKTGRLNPVQKLPGKTGAYLFSRSAIEHIARRAA